MRSIALAVLLLAHGAIALADPPFSRAAYIEPNLITEADVSELAELTDNGRGVRSMFDRRDPFGEVTVNAYLFGASFSNGGPVVEVQVNSEFGSTEAAMVEAEFYLEAIGRLPRAARADLLNVQIHAGDQIFSAGNNSLVIHTGSLAEGYLDDGVLEEILLTEAASASLTELFNDRKWRTAQGDDPEFISNRALGDPDGEDVPESFLAWLAVRHAADRLDAATIELIEDTMPNRLAYFDDQGFDVNPIGTEAPEPGQFWIVGLGQFDGNRLVVADAVSTRGGAFGDAFDPAAIENVPWGSIEIEVTDCALGTVTWAALDSAAKSFGSGGYDIQRIAPNDAQRSCEAVGFGSGFDPRWANGSWFGGLERSGEGFLIDVLEGGQAFIAWFTYGTR